MSLLDVKYQTHAHQQIQRAIEQDRLGHAYVFHGPDGVGKELFARGLAELALCQTPVRRDLVGDDADQIGLASLTTGCGGCDDCRALGASAHPDWHLIYRQLNREHPDPIIRRRKALEIGVDVLRHFVIEKVGLTPVRGRAKVFVIREADRMTVQAQNALLKTLEEPPPRTHLILLAGAVDRLLETTRSRCQLVRFDPLPTDFVQARLLDLAVDMPPDRVGWYARMADGSLGRAVQSVEDDLFTANEGVIDSLAQLPQAGHTVVLKTWNDTAKSLGDIYKKQDPDISDTEATRRGYQAIFKSAAMWYADVLRTRNGAEDTGLGVINQSRQDQLIALAKSTPSPTATEAVNRLALAERQLHRNANTQLCLEVLVNDLARIGAK